MEDNSTGRGVYVVRRVLAVLVLLLLFALLFPQAYQALLEPRDETGLGVQEAAEVGDSGNDGSYKEVASNGVAVVAADEMAKQDDESDNSSNSGESGFTEDAASTSRGLGTSEGDYGGEESIEPDTALVGVADVLEEVAVGEAGQAVANPVVDAGGQESIQPILPAEPIVPLELLASVKPIMIEDAILLQDPPYYDYPVYYEDPAYYDYAAYHEDPAYYDYSVYYEEQVFVESDNLDTYYGAAVVAASAQADGEATAYAAAGGGAGAYAAA